MEKTLTALTLALGLLGAHPAHAEVNIGINVGTPAPPPVIVAPPPQVVIVPGTTAYHAPSLGYNLFVHNGRYYSFHHGAWFYTPKWGAAWTPIAVERVPRPVLAIPVTYYRIPPGHAKKLGPPAPAGAIVESRGPKK
jgi:hypothetical protein